MKKKPYLHSDSDEVDCFLRLKPGSSNKQQHGGRGGLGEGGERVGWGRGRGRGS